MAPFLIKHPVLIHNWVLARETALSRVIALESHTPETLSLLSKYLLQAIQHIAEWNVEDSRAWRTEDTDKFFYEIEEKKND